MRMKVVTFILSLLVALLAVVRAHSAIDCFQTSALKGGTDANISVATDLAEIVKIDLEHTITTVKVCTNRKATAIVGL